MTIDLETIRQFVRQITRSNSLSQLSNEELDLNINYFLLFHLPSNIRLFSLRSTLTFYTQPGVDVYASSDDTTNNLYDFKNRYVAIHPPVYLAGVPGYFTQQRDIFYNIYPQTNFIADTLLRGDGTVGPFTGTVTAKPMLQNNVLFTCLDQSGNAMTLVDYPVSNTTGALGLQNTPQALPSPYGQINYITGVFTLNFPSLTLDGATIFIENIAYQPGKPSSILYYDNKFTIRPVPDKAYPIQVEVDRIPTELINAQSVPDIKQWWEYIAYGAAILLLERRVDYDTINLIMPSFEKRQLQVSRTSLTQYTNERAPTIYVLGRNLNYGWPSGY